MAGSIRGQMGGQGLVNNRAALKLFILFGGFLRGLSESRKLRSNFGRVPQQPEKDEKLAAVHQPLSTHLPVFGTTEDPNKRLTARLENNERQCSRVARNSISGHRSSINARFTRVGAR
jgi:hypothetical protein